MFLLFYSFSSSSASCRAMCFPLGLLQLSSSQHWWLGVGFLPCRLCSAIHFLVLHSVVVCLCFMRICLFLTDCCSAVFLRSSIARCALWQVFSDMRLCSQLAEAAKMATISVLFSSEHFRPVAVSFAKWQSRCFLVVKVVFRLCLSVNVGAARRCS